MIDVPYDNYNFKIFIYNKNLTSLIVRNTNFGDDYKDWNWSTTYADKISALKLFYELKN